VHCVVQGSFSLRSLGLYIFRQVIGPFFFFAVILTCVIWLSQSLQVLDMVMNKGQSAGTFLWLTFLILPGLMAIVLPVSFFCAVLYVLHRLQTDSELVVMWAAGLSRWAVIAPLLAAAVLMTALTYLLNLYLMPLGMREMKDKVFEIRADLAATLVKEGAFSTPIDGLTVYIKESSNTELLGILVHDNRDTERPATYMASRGQLVKTPDGPRLIMFDGNIQRSEGRGKSLSILDFDKYTFDLSVFEKPNQGHNRETRERYLDELIDFVPKDDWEARNRDVFAAEGHSRLSSPLYNIVFVLVAAAFLLTGRFSRRGQGWKVAGAMGCGVIARLGGFGLQGLVADEPWLTATLYVFPLLWIGVCVLMVANTSFNHAPATASAVPEAAE
jgi:lipopolysaccharide export system permease protein